MSWVSGIHDKLASSSRHAHALRDGGDVRGEIAVGEHHALRLARRPDENWMNATSSVDGRCSMPRFETSAISSRNTVRFSRRAKAGPMAVVVGVGAQPVEHPALRSAA
jgi:hypothetical protein